MQIEFLFMLSKPVQKQHCRRNTADQICQRRCPDQSVDREQDPQQQHQRNIHRSLPQHCQRKGLTVALYCLEEGNHGVGKC